MNRPMLKPLVPLLLLAYLACPVAAEGLEMSELAARFPGHQTATILYCNFDGWLNYDGKGHLIIPFESTSGNRDRDIQEILYRLAETFAPFNVRVVRIKGQGKYSHGPNGHTTIFFGANTNNINAAGLKYANYVTPSKYCDFPSQARGTNQRPNSQPFHIAYVDPIGQKDENSGWLRWDSNITIARHAAHEAGHTFGLAHISSGGIAEYMSYDTEVKTYFANRAFPISDLNFDPKTQKKIPNWKGVPVWQNAPVTSQNSYACLMHLLGPRPAGDHPRVADRRTVDPGYQESEMAQLDLAGAATGEIAPRGDYDCFGLDATETQLVTVRVQPDPGSKLRPVVFVFDRLGNRIMSFGSALANKTGTCTASWQVVQGQSYRIVVGAADGATTGHYTVSLSRGHVRAVPVASAHSHPVPKSPTP